MIKTAVTTSAMGTTTMYKFGIRRQVIQKYPNGTEREVSRMFYGKLYHTAIEAVQANAKFMANNPLTMCMVVPVQLNGIENNGEIIPE